jgi:hypothetical protein
MEAWSLAFAFRYILLYSYADTHMHTPTAGDLDHCYLGNLVVRASIAALKWSLKRAGRITQITVLW